MPRFPFSSMAYRARKDPLGPVTLNQLKANVEALQQQSLFEHSSVGLHNALEIPAFVGRTVWSGGAYTNNLYGAGPGGSVYSSKTNPAVGKVTLTLASSLWTLPNVSVITSACEEDVLNKPWVVTAELTSTSSLSLYMRKLTSALGAGNAWAAADGSFAIIGHALPYQTFPTLSTLADAQRRQALEDSSTGWNGIVGLQGGVRADALIEHDSSGQHVAERIAKEYAYVHWDSAGVKYNIIAGTVGSTSYISTGVCEITTTNTYASTGVMAAFLQVVPSSNVDLWVINYRATATNKVRAYLYQYSGGNWARANADFFVSVWGT